MMILHDGHGKFLEIEMIGKNGVAWENDFFEAGKLEKAKIDLDCIRADFRERWGTETIYFVDDVEYCLEQALDCQNCVGDFADCEPDTEVNATLYESNEVVI